MRNLLIMYLNLAVCALCLIFANGNGVLLFLAGANAMEAVWMGVEAVRQAA